MNTTPIKIWTDGSAKGNGTKNARGGYAYIIEYPGQTIERSYGEANTTNQRMELQAAVAALEAFSRSHFNHHPAVVYSDSAYLVNCWKDRWWVNWKSNGWRNSKKRPVANQDLWERLIPFFQLNLIRFEKVKGHSGNEMNERVDTLAQNASNP